MCVACRQMYPKKDMHRVSRTTSGEYVIDTTGKLDGRGAYVCNNQSCVAKCVKSKLFNKSFKACVDNNVYVELDKHE